MLSTQVVAALNTVVVTTLMSTICEPAGTAIKLPVKVPNTTGADWETTVQPVLRTVLAVVPVVFLVVPSSQGPK
jgi:hypothetical protein